MQHVVAGHQEPLVSVNDSFTGQLGTALKGVCNLLSFYEFLSRVDNGSDFYLLLSQNIVDACEWVSFKEGRA